MCPEYAKDIFDYLKQREVSQTRNTVTKFQTEFEAFLSDPTPEANFRTKPECKGHLSVFISSLLLCWCLQEKFVLCNYMPNQPTLNPEMRAILIDWLVEVQVSFPGRL